MLEQGEEGKEVFVLVEGTFHLEDHAVQPVRRIHSSDGVTLTQKGVVGELEVVLKRKVRYAVVAGKEGAKMLCVEGKMFMDLVNVSRSFREAVANCIRSMVELFNTTDLLMREIDSFVLSGRADFEKMQEIYGFMNSTLHPFRLSEQLDLGALNYSVRRLPNNVSRTHLWVFGAQPPNNLDPSGVMLLTSSPARRRHVWDMGNGMAFVLCSDTFTDLADFFTCLCCYVIEARKLRLRMTSIRTFAGNHIIEGLKAAVNGETEELQRLFLREYFSEGEFLKLREIWPKNLLRSCREIIIHHENFSFRMQKNNFTKILPVDAWMENVRRASLELFPCLDNVIVSIISSNMHSVVNLVSPWIHNNRTMLLEWGQKFSPEASCKFYREDDLLYYFVHTYLKFNPSAVQEKLELERKHGIVTVDEMFGTGISIQLINPDLIDYDHIDQVVAQNIKYAHLSSETAQLILNIDFAFGKQAESILNSLILLFGTNIRSVNVLGKAGAIIGKRGDILLPTHFVMFHEECAQPVKNIDLDVDRLIVLANSSDLYRGPILTVLGTFVQNADSLHYFEQLWNCIGLEMEGYYFARAIDQGIMKGLLDPDVISRYLYYVSDVPLAITGNLTEKLEPWEGIPPLYAIVRSIFENALCVDPGPKENQCSIAVAPISVTKYSCALKATTSNIVESVASLRHATASYANIPRSTSESAAGSFE